MNWNKQNIIDINSPNWIATTNNQQPLQQLQVSELSDAATLANCEKVWDILSNDKSNVAIDAHLEKLEKRLEKYKLIKFLCLKTWISQLIINDYIDTDHTIIETYAREQLKKITSMNLENTWFRKLAHYFWNAYYAIRVPKQMHTEFFDANNYAWIIKKIKECENNWTKNTFITGLDHYAVLPDIMSVISDNQLSNYTEFFADVDRYIEENQFSIFEHPWWLVEILKKYKV
jgi:hypothetical protein